MKEHTTRLKNKNSGAHTDIKLDGAASHLGDKMNKEQIKMHKQFYKNYARTIKNERTKSSIRYDASSFCQNFSGV